jgi:hypothetical protein
MIITGMRAVERPVHDFADALAGSVGRSKDNHLSASTSA